MPDTTPKYPVVDSSEETYLNRFGDPRQKDWYSGNMTTVTSPSGVKFSVNKQAAPAFQSFLGDLEGRGYKINPGDSGSYNLRPITGGTTLSPHAFGAAIDLNASTNPYGKSLKTDMPPDVADVAAKYGIAWGGNFSTNKDAMHFEYVGNQPDKSKSMVAQAPAATAPAVSATAAPATTPAATTSAIDPRTSQLQRLAAINKLLAPQDTSANNPFIQGVPWARTAAQSAPTPLEQVTQLAQLQQQFGATGPTGPAGA